MSSLPSAFDQILNHSNKVFIQFAGILLASVLAKLRPVGRFHLGYYRQVTGDGKNLLRARPSIFSQPPAGRRTRNIDAMKPAANGGMADANVRR